MDTKTYERSLKKHLAGCRKKAPLPKHEDLSAMDDFQYRVLGGHLLHWLREWGPDLLAERAVLAGVAGWDENPVICFESSMPGLVAAAEIMNGVRSPVLCGLPEDLASFDLEDPEFNVHVVLRSFFESPSAAQATELARTYPLQANETYLFHYDETIMGPLFARGGRHLWKWDGQQMSLLCEGFESFVS